MFAAVKPNRNVAGDAGAEAMNERIQFRQAGQGVHIHNQAHFFAFFQQIGGERSAQSQFPRAVRILKADSGARIRQKVAQGTRRHPRKVAVHPVV